MADLISRDALLSKVKTAAIPEGSDYVTEHDVLFAPAVDAVPVVRCRDCKYWQDNNGGYPHQDCKWNANETPDEDDYCSCGERKETDNG
jgi:hypothetical protein